MVGIENDPQKRAVYALSAPDLLNLPTVGTAKELDLEVVASLEPDLLILPMKLKNTVEMLETLGFDVLLVEPGGPAQEGGVMPGDIMTHVEGEPVSELGINATGDKVRGPEGTTVNITFLRGEEVLELTLERRTIQVAVAEYEMLPDNIGYIKINNFNSKCADETIAAVDALIERGAQALIFDVRNNPGGYVDELVAVLDHLLPEGVLFRSESYDGKQTIRESDKKCIELPMAVLFNGESYSAAEFFAAALEEYDWAITVGDPTCGKSYYQNTFELGDGSAVGLSTGKYSTPNGVVLAEVGGLTPQILVEVDDQTAAMIYADMLEPEDDPQLQAAIAALK
jgi:carboxyl-terminal processing protease